VKENNEPINAIGVVPQHSFKDTFDDTFARHLSEPVHSSTTQMPTRYNKTFRGISLSVDTDEKQLEGSLENKPYMFQRMRTHLEEHDFLFITLLTLPSGLVLHLGGIVSSRSVKLLDKINNPDEPETRDSWWNELRCEIRSHAKAMGCQAVLGYSEYSTICDDLIVLSAYGTAAVINTSARYSSHCDIIPEIHASDKKDVQDIPILENGERCDNSFERKKIVQRQIEFDTCSATSSQVDLSPTNGNTDQPCEDNATVLPSCHICHIPYSDVDLPLPISLTKCIFCRYNPS